MRTDYINKDIIGHILASLTYENQLICRVSLETGLRVGDVLRLKSDFLLKEKFTIKEEKTGKPRNVWFSKSLREELLKIAGKIYVFEHRTDGRKHKTRQAVFKDLKRSAFLFRVKENVAPHTLRKIYAVDQYNRSGKNIKKVQKLLNHSSEAVTYLYAMADQINKKKGAV